MDGKRIVETILEQLKNPDRMRFFSWGANKFVFDENVGKGEVSLRFTVNGAIFKGKVQVVYVKADDLYRLEFYQGIKIVKTFEMVYAENLAEIIDEQIEKPL